MPITNVDEDDEVTVVVVFVDVEEKVEEKTPMGRLDGMKEEK